MNSPPRPPTTNHLRGHPREFKQIIQEKSQNFVGREFVFTAINNFLDRDIATVTSLSLAHPVAVKVPSSPNM
ncbi:hypothetical protein [Nostoc sphaeroides]|uniref:hypothetical protein n=1 Tax=Nostoc sphaeroides TaxID=446679 RepID=UPI002B400007|nr:hypothetical protein [Nostoc sphaeroides]